MSYSQSDEEAIILAHVGEKGYVLDVGAFDGRRYSNSLALIEKGWRGVLIEPSPSAFISLLELHGNNPNVTLINAAMGVENTLREFYDFPGDLCSTMDKDNAKLWADTGRKMRKYLVAQMTPDMLVQQIAGGPDVISIDTEGSSFDILTRLPIGAWVPRVLVIEHDSRVLEISKWGKSKGYHVRELDDQNVILVAG